MEEKIKKLNNINKKPWIEPLLNYFRKMKELNYKIENIRIKLCGKENFHPRKLFIILDLYKTRYLSSKNIINFLEKENKYKYDDEIVRCLIRIYDKDEDYNLNFEEFLNIIIPIKNDSVKEKILLLSKEKLDSDIDNNISNEINTTFIELLKEELDFIKDSSNLIKNIYNSPQFTTYDVFINIVKNESYITKENLNIFFKENNFVLNDEKDLYMIMFRIDKNNDNRISYLEFQDIFYTMKNRGNKNSFKENQINQKEKEIKNKPNLDNINKENINKENNNINKENGNNNINIENINKENNSENILNYNYDIYSYNYKNFNQKYKILNNNYFIKNGERKRLYKSYSQNVIKKENSNLENIKINKNIECNNLNKNEEQKNSKEIENKYNEKYNIKKSDLNFRVKYEYEKILLNKINNGKSLTDRTKIIKSDFNFDKNQYNNLMKYEEYKNNKIMDYNNKNKIQFSNLQSQNCFQFSLITKNNIKFLIKNFSDIQYINNKNIKNTDYTSMTERILNNSKKKMLSKKVNKYKLNFNYLNVYNKSLKSKIINKTNLPKSMSSHNINFTNYFKLKNSETNDNNSIKSRIKIKKILFELLNSYINQEIEFQKILEKLYQCSDFNIKNFFQTFLCSKKSISIDKEIITMDDIYKTLINLNMNNIEQKDIIYILIKFNKKITKKENINNIGITYDEFCKIMTPENIPKNSNDKKYQKYFMGFCFRTNRIICSLFKHIIDSEKSNENLRRELIDNEIDKNKISIKIRNLFDSLKIKNNVDYLDINDFEIFVGIYNKKLDEIEKNILLKKFCKNKKVCVDYNDFFNEIFPKLYSI